MQARDIQRVYRLCDYHKTQLIPPGQAYCDTGNANSAGELYLVIESARPDTKHLEIPLLLLTLTAQEGCLAVDSRASLNTDQVSSTPAQRDICVPWPWKSVPLSASKPAETLLF